MLFETFWEHTVRLVVNCWSYSNRPARCIFSFPRMDTPFDFDCMLFYLQKQTFPYQVPLDNPSISSHILSIHSYSEILKGNSSRSSFVVHSNLMSDWRWFFLKIENNPFLYSCTIDVTLYPIFYWWNDIYCWMIYFYVLIWIRREGWKINTFDYIWNFGHLHQDKSPSLI